MAKKIIFYIKYSIYFIMYNIENISIEYITLVWTLWYDPKKNLWKTDVDVRNVLNRPGLWKLREEWLADWVSDKLTQNKLKLNIFSIEKFL